MQHDIIIWYGIKLNPYISSRRKYFTIQKYHYQIINTNEAEKLLVRFGWPERFLQLLHSRTFGYAFLLGFKVVRISITTKILIGKFYDNNWH